MKKYTGVVFLTRYVNGSDPVTKVPPLLFPHVHRHTQINEGGSNITGIPDHDMSLYRNGAHKKDRLLAELVLDVYRMGDNVTRVGDSEFIMVREAGRLFIAVGGSAGMGDWIQNIRVLPWYEQGLGLCHRGFLLGARDIYGSPALQKALHSEHTRSIHIAGHSKGAAEATIVAAMLKRDGYPVYKLTTFGSPRCVSSGAANILKAI